MTQPPSPAVAATNTRPYLIFWSYMGTCLLLTISIISNLVRNSAVLKRSKTARLPPTQHVQLFAALAAGSLLTTWGFMIRYFQFSYQAWFELRSHYALDPQQKHWGLWLKETSLFKEAWETVIVSETRYWWSHQIFFFALWLGLYLEHPGNQPYNSFPQALLTQAGIRRGIKHTWAFMLLGQIVAISFATNLFLLTLLLHTPTQAPASTPETARTPSQKRLGSWLITLFSLFATAIPAWLLADKHYWHTPSFMPILLTPHLALMVLPLARLLLPARCFSNSNENLTFVDKVHKHMGQLTLGAGSLMLVRTTAQAYAIGGFQGIQHTLFEHPAVSSVGFDVVFCWITWICWWKLQGQGVGNSTRNLPEKQDENLNVGSSTTVSDSNIDAGTRRR